MPNWLKTLTLALLICIFIAIIYFGNQRYDAAIAREGAESARWQQEYEELKLQKHQEEIERWKPNGSSRSLMDDIRYTHALKGEVKVAAVGSAVVPSADNADAGTHWSSFMKQHLRSAIGYDGIKWSDYRATAPGLQALWAENKLEEATGLQPDLFILDTMIADEHMQSVPIQSAMQSITDTVYKIQTEVPDAKLLLLSSPPKEVSETRNNLGLTLNDYAYSTGVYMSAHGWDYVDLYSEFRRQPDLAQLIEEDGQLAEEGHQIIFDIIKSRFELKK